MNLDGLTPSDLRAALPSLLDGAVDAPPETRAALSAIAEATLQATDDDALAATLRAFGAAGGAWTTWPADPFARRLSRAWLGGMTRGATITGLRHLEPLDGRPTLFVGNHLSYVDTSVLDLLLAANGRADLADNLLAVAGPKVYSAPFRRLAAIALNTLKTPQSTTLDGNDAALSLREVAALALGALREAEAWRASRGPVVLYPEGTRSRDGQLGPFLPAAARYLRGAAWVVPVVVRGTDALFGRDERFRPQPVQVAFGEAFDPGAVVGDAKTAALEEARRRVLGVMVG